MKPVSLHIIAFWKVRDNPDGKTKTLDGYVDGMGLCLNNVVSIDPRQGGTVETESSIYRLGRPEDNNEEEKLDVYAMAPFGRPEMDFS